MDSIDISTSDCEDIRSYSLQLERLLEDESQDHRLRLLAARALGDTGSLDCAQALCRALNDAYPSVRHEAVIALGKIGGQDACEALSNLLESESLRVRSIAARALIQISGVPDPKEANLEQLMRLICSGDRRVKETVLQIGDPALTLLIAQLEADSFLARQEAAGTLAMHIRRLIDRLPAGENPVSWLEEQGFSAKSISDLYSHRVIRLNGSPDRVENSGFDTVSKTLCGDGLLPRLSERFEQPELEIRTINLEDLLAKYGAGEPKRVGRTLVADFECGCLAIKLCTKEGDAPGLSAEAQMQSILQGFGLSSRLPRPLGGLFRIQGLSINAQGLKLSDPLAICYIANSDYFRYLGDPSIPLDEMRRALASCADDLGRLSRNGLIHTSLIPLFHNKGRAIGDSTYRWNRKIAGRLDNWLESCMYPNLRLSGIADLEHIEIFPEMAAWEMQSHAGEQLLSMSLVLGSYFRRRERFDERALCSILKNCFQRYCCSLAGSEDRTLKCALECIDWSELAGRMADEMDWRMGSRAQTGPHLGRFNGPFPIPELMRAIHITTIFAVLELQAHGLASGEAGTQG